MNPHSRRAFLNQAVLFSGAVVVAGCAGRVQGARAIPSANAAKGFKRTPRASGSGPGWSFNVTSSGDGSTYTENGVTYTVHVTDSYGSWQLVDPSGNVVLSNQSSDGVSYVLSSSAATASINYNSLVVGATIPVATQTMTLPNSNQTSGSDGSSLTVTNNGTANATFVSAVPAGTDSTVVGYPGGGASGTGGRIYLATRACQWAVADMTLAQASLILAAFTLETGIGFAAFILAYAAAASAYFHMKEACASS